VGVSLIQQQPDQHAGKLDERHPSDLTSGSQQSAASRPMAAGGGGGGQPVPSSPAATGSLEQPPNHYRTIISNSRIYILENASLVIRDVSKQDQGYYLCQAANNYGLLSALIKLTVNGECC
jgi:hypothetical protein